MAAIVGYNKSTIVNYELGHRLPDVEFLAAFANATGTDVYDLVNKRLRSSDEAIPQMLGEELTKKMHGVPSRIVDKRGDLVDINLYNVRASAGPGIALDDERVVGTRSFQKSWVIDHLRMNPEELALVVVHGDSMQPTLGDGDLIMVNMAQNRLARDGIYLLREGEDLMVKRLQRLPGGRFRMISDNPQYASTDYHALVLSDGTLTLVGRVIWWAHTDV